MQKMTSSQQGKEKQEEQSETQRSKQRIPFAIISSQENIPKKHEAEENESKLLKLMSKLDRQALSCTQDDQLILNLNPDQLKLISISINFWIRDELSVSYENIQQKDFNLNKKLSYQEQRRRLTEWIFTSLCGVDSCSYQTAFLATNIFDNFLKEYEGLYLENEQAIILCVVSILLASKLVDMQPVELRNFKTFFRGKIPLDQIQFLEQKFLDLPIQVFDQIDVSYQFNEIIDFLEINFLADLQMEDSKKMIIAKFVLIKNLGYNYLRLMLYNIEVETLSNQDVVIATVLLLFETILIKNQKYFISTIERKKEDYLVINELIKKHFSRNNFEKQILQLKQQIEEIIIAEAEKSGWVQLNFQY